MEYIAYEQYCYTTVEHFVLLPFFSYQALYNSAIQELNKDICIDADSDTDSESG